MKYTKPPLPFNGNKRNMLKQIDCALDEMQSLGYITKDTIFYDVFGGSGLVSHFVKQKYPHNRVVWNDYDNYQMRLDMIEHTQEIKEVINNILTAHKCEHGEEILKAAAQEIKASLQNALEKNGGFDYITISSYLFFSGTYAKSEKDIINKKKFYNKSSSSRLEKCGYLLGVERESKDFREFITEIYKNTKPQNAFLILDPPYIQTEKVGYSNYFGLKDFLDLASMIQKPFIYFSSAKSEILDFIEFIKNPYNFNAWKDITYQGGKLSINAKDNMDYILYERSKGLFDCCESTKRAHS